MYVQRRGDFHAIPKMLAVTQLGLSNLSAVAFSFNFAKFATCCYFPFPDLFTHFILDFPIFLWRYVGSFMDSILGDIWCQGHTACPLLFYELRERNRVWTFIKDYGEWMNWMPVPHVLLNSVTWGRISRWKSLTVEKVNISSYNHGDAIGPPRWWQFRIP